MTSSMLRHHHDEVAERQVNESSGERQKEEAPNGLKNHELERSHGFYFLSDDAVQQLPHFQYKGEDRSLLYIYLLSPLAEFLVQNFVPINVAPNTITLSGLLLMVVAYMAVWFYLPSLDDDENSSSAPGWIFLLNGIAILVYQTLDNMDGKQARRTKSSSPLGLLFDHGCDAINCIIGSANWILSLGLDPKTSTIDFLLCWIIVMGPMSQFYFSTWEEYYTGALILPIVNGPNEGLLGGAIHSFTTAVMGRSYWTSTSWYNGVIRRFLPQISHMEGLLLFGTRNVDLQLWLASVIFVQEVILKTLHILRHYGIAALINLVPMVILLSCTLTIGLYDRNIWIRMPRTTLHLWSGLFVNMVTQFMLDHITHQTYRPLQQIVALLPLIFLTKWTVLGQFALVDTDEFLLVYATAMWTFLGLKFKMVIFEVCAVLRISCFEINCAPAARGKSGENDRRLATNSVCHLKEN